MTVSIVALDRGGFSAAGGAWFDPRDRVVRLAVFDPDDSVEIVVQYSFTPSEVAYEEDGISSSTPVISSNTVTILAQALSANGTYKLTAYASSGASRTLLIQAHNDQPDTDGVVDVDIDYGVI